MFYGSTILLIFFCAVGIFLSGCRTTKPVNSAGETAQDVEKSMGTVAGAMAGRSLSPEEMKALQMQIRKDPEARSAVESLTASDAHVVKYCPIDGQRYAGKMTVCPDHNVKLEIVQP